jgi:ferredoxin
VKVFVEQDKCCGSGTCVLIAPEVFNQRDDDGIVILLDERPPVEFHSIVHEAASVCPGAAILTSEDA